MVADNLTLAESSREPNKLLASIDHQHVANVEEEPELLPTGE